MITTSRGGWRSNARQPCTEDVIIGVRSDDAPATTRTTTATATAAGRTTSSRRTFFFVALLAAMASTSVASPTKNALPYPPLAVVENSLLTTAQESYGGRAEGFEATARWTGDRLDASDDEGYLRRGPHLVCAGNAQGREAIFRLQTFLTPEAVRPIVVHSSEHGGSSSSCFVVTALRAEAREIASNPDFFGVASIAPFPSDLKIAPGVLEHELCCSGGAGSNENNHEAEQQQQQQQQQQEKEVGGQEDTPQQTQQQQQSGTRTTTKLGTTHGPSMRLGSAQGLTVELSPGTLPARSPQAPAFTAQLTEDLMSESIDLFAGNVWSDPAVAGGGHLATEGGAARGKDWTLAAALVHGVSREAKVLPGDVCAWDRVWFHLAGDDVLFVSGMMYGWVYGICCGMLPSFSSPPIRSSVRA